MWTTLLIVHGLLAVALLGAITHLQDYRMLAAEGAFEIKEHLAAIALFLLPLYWYIWRNAAAASDSFAQVREVWIAQGALSALIGFAAWSSFFIGHILNNIRGLFGT